MIISLLIEGEELYIVTVYCCLSYNATKVLQQ